MRGGRRLAGVCRLGEERTKKWMKQRRRPRRSCGRPQLQKKRELRRLRVRDALNSHAPFLPPPLTRTHTHPRTDTTHGNSTLAHGTRHVIHMRHTCTRTHTSTSTRVHMHAHPSPADTVSVAVSPAKTRNRIAKEKRKLASAVKRDLITAAERAETMLRADRQKTVAELKWASEDWQEERERVEEEYLQRAAAIKSEVLKSRAKTREVGMAPLPYKAALHPLSPQVYPPILGSPPSLFPTGESPSSHTTYLPHTTYV